jgi:hypothetical protein
VPSHSSPLFASALLVPFVVATGCSGGDIAGPSPEAPPSPGLAPAAPPVKGGDVPADPAASWDALYARYFAPGTIGHCGNAACHLNERSGFACGTTAQSCLDGLVAVGVLDPYDPASSELGDPESSPLSWFGNDGAMPKDAPHQDAEAAGAVTRWLRAGAPGIEHPADDPGAGDAGVTRDAGPDAGADGGPARPTWTALYDKYFGPGTVGHCGNSGCHKTTRSGFACGTTKTSCYSGMVRKGLVDPANPTRSILGDKNTTPLAWFGTGGPMPKDKAVKNSAAAKAVRAWVLAGAPSD